ncbi:MAG: hypothetical protein KKC46_23060 [Proteobacteria bacterium]|nr:hypothetical protein [Pseudomonadota bacterium]
MILQTWSEVLPQSFQNLWFGVIGFVPNLVVAILIFAVGWVVGALLGRVVMQMVRSLKLDKLLRSTGLESTLNKAGFRLDTGKFIGGLIKWFIIVVFAIAAFDVLGLTQVNQFLQQVVLLYLPRVIAAVFILLIAAILAEAVENVVKGSAKAADIKVSNLLGAISRWAIWVFAILMALYQLGVAAAFVQTLFTGLVVAVALAAGLAFGLGGKDAATDAIESIKHSIKK